MAVPASRRRPPRMGKRLIAPLELCPEPVQQKQYGEPVTPPRPRMTSDRWRPRSSDKRARECLGEISTIVQRRASSPMSKLPPAQILPHVYLGCETDAMDSDLLRSLGVSAVVNCAAGSILANKDMFPPETMYLELEAQDFPAYDILAHFDDVKNFLDDVKRTDRKALVFCAQGVNRSAALVVAYFLSQTRQNVVSCVRECFEKRPIILQNEGFVHQLVYFATCNHYPLTMSCAP
eukprot:m.476052 g.476052  ORF g.476052 m.476052 type:complete len:235 (-) comp20413_c1_seq1:110-814(-)